MSRNCLTYEQLQNYSLNKSNNNDRALQYEHISTCELCACAVNGFTAMPFTLAEVNAIHHQVDVKANATHANPLTFAQAFVVTFSLAAIFGFYHFADSFSHKRTAPMLIEKEQPETVPQQRVKQIIPIPVKDALVVEKTQQNNSVISKKIPEKTNIRVETIESITARLVQPVAEVAEEFSAPAFNTDVIYIYDLKVSDYNKLYFNNRIKPFEIKGHTPSFKENKDSPDNVSGNETERVIAADRVLKSGLALFNKGKYTKALAEFQWLLENNPADVNCLFYSAVAYYNLGKYQFAVKNLEAVLQSSNNVFHPEAKWNLSLVNLKIGEKGKAKQLLIEIMNEKGFYSKRAAEKLKDL